MIKDKIFPFLWIKESGCKIEEEIKAIKEYGLDSFCVESRVHSDFCGDKWWQDIDEVIRCAEKYDMRFWILDDKRYPTGYCNGEVEKHANLRPRFISAHNRDVVCDGEIRQIYLRENEDNKLIGAYAIGYRNKRLNYNDVTEITDGKKGEWLFFKLKKGDYRIVLIYIGKNGWERENFIDMMNPTSVQLLIDEVYEKHYARYKKYFGKTIVGFFSDEPRLCDGYTDKTLSGNVNDYEHKIGTLGAAYPYLTNVLEDFCKERNIKVAFALLALWYEIESFEAIRCAFMEEITQAYAQNFSKRIGSWCAERGVAYAGHIIEDMNAHTHSGCSCGNYFTSQEGQVLSGCDVVLHQIKPYSTDINHIAAIASGFSSPDFFAETLPKLAFSDYMLDRSKNGAVVELFGAYGWCESARDMKWIADVFLVNSVKYFIPHAFCSFTDNLDCPPHFNENGKNPQKQALKSIFSYMKTVAELTGKPSNPKVGLLYNSEAEWSGKKYQNIDSAVRKLNENQIPFVIIPPEKLGAYAIELLIIPNGYYETEKTRKTIEKLQKCGLTTINAQKIDYNELKKRYHGRCRVNAVNKKVRICDCENPMIFQLSDCASECEFVMDGKKDNYLLFDPMNGIGERVGKRFKLKLHSGETRIVLDNACLREHKEKTHSDTAEYELGIYEDGVFKQLSEKVGIGAVNEIISNYSGCVAYRGKYIAERDGEYEFCFDKFGGAIELKINGNTEGVRPTYPSRFRVKLKKGENAIEYLFYNTYANEKKDELSDYDAIEPFGLLSRPSVFALDEENFLEEIK